MPAAVRASACLGPVWLTRYFLVGLILQYNNIRNQLQSKLCMNYFLAENYCLTSTDAVSNIVPVYYAPSI